MWIETKETYLFVKLEPGLDPSKTKQKITSKDFPNFILEKTDVGLELLYGKFMSVLCVHLESAVENNYTPMSDVESLFNHLDKTILKTSMTRIFLFFGSGLQSYLYLRVQFRAV